MKTRLVRDLIVPFLAAVAILAGSAAHAAAGYMGFLDGTNTVVRTGDASSYMRAGLDWDKATLSPTGVALPTLLQSATITTSRTATALNLRFVIPDATRTQTGGGVSTLACGDQVIVQIGRVATTAAIQLTNGDQFRFELSIRDGLLTGGAVTKRLPRPAGHPLGNGWNTIAEPMTAASATVNLVGNSYDIFLTIPLTEVGNPTTDIGLALALINDLGHAAVAGVNEASGTAFPVGMGLTPESDPFFSCGTLTVPTGETATGNWLNPSTWGVGYFSVASVPPDVTLDQGPSFYLSRAIRLGRCSILNFGDIAEVTTSNWAAIQQNVANNWYLYNPAGPCRMTIWVNATVAGAGVVTKRFLAVWGRPGISPQDWFVAGLSDPVAIAQPTTAISFVWNNPPAVAFTDHPCLRVYVLPDVLPTAVQTAINTLTMTPTNANLAAFEAAAGVAQGSSKSAQMNFGNIGTGTCTEAACAPVIVGDLDRPAFDLGEIFSSIGTAHAQEVEVRPDPNRPPADQRPNLVRIVAHGYGVAEPRPDRDYVYIESIGGLGWAVPAERLAQGTVSLNFEVANPAYTEKMFVNGTAVVVGSPPRRIFVAPVISVVDGTPIPNLDLSPLRPFADTPVAAGQVIATTVTLGSEVVEPFPRWWLWVVLALVLVIVIVALLRRASTP